jgi:Raf kinase inhibitor-like YbhB/YbcL family protein
VTVRLLLAASFFLTSPAFHANGPIPPAYTCDGRNTSPPLVWTAPPRGTRSLALQVYDADAHFTHWLAWGISPGARKLRAAQKPPLQGRNDFSRLGYSGPCPPKKGKPHHYLFTLFALARAPSPKGSNATAFNAALTKAHILATSTLTGTYRRR